MQHQTSNEDFQVQIQQTNDAMSKTNEPSIKIVCKLIIFHIIIDYGNSNCNISAEETGSKVGETTIKNGKKNLILEICQLF